MKTTTLTADKFEDSRGVILSFPIDDNLVEYNLMITKKGDQRGFHFHPHFDEYMLVVEGQCEFLEFSDDGNHERKVLNVGDSIRIPVNTAHTFTALTDFKFVSMLTKQWDKSEPPIIKVGEDGKPI